MFLRWQIAKSACTEQFATGFLLGGACALTLPSYLACRPSHLHIHFQLYFHSLIPSLVSLVRNCTFQILMQAPQNLKNIYAYISIFLLHHEILRYENYFFFSNYNIYTQYKYIFVTNYYLVLIR